VPLALFGMLVRFSALGRGFQVTRSSGRRLTRKTGSNRSLSHTPSLFRSALDKAQNWNLRSSLYRLFSSSSISVPEKSTEGFDGPTDDVRPLLSPLPSSLFVSTPSTSYYVPISSILVVLTSFDVVSGLKFAY